ncbi:MAG: hypothetical protein LBP54_02005 [Campylobacteraceae bacterium]|jgi:hypothetical protein|nr:hypothetical protein [Campylobacteraceae bacterium]
MKKLFILMNHNLMESQIKEAKEVLKIDEIIDLSDSTWANIDPDKEKITYELTAYKERLTAEANKDNYLLVQGDFSATYSMVNFAFINGIIPVYAVTKRESKEQIIDGKVVITREFIHARFREYEQ